jgi:hypothetical protein
MKTTLYGITLSIFLCTRVFAVEPPAQAKPATAPAAASNAGSLKWEQTQIELHPKPGDKDAVAHFKYENVGKTPVRFKSVHASCGCTTAQTQKEEVPPGEKGEITATFTIGGRTGTQVKTVSVATDDPKAPNTTLTLKAVLPQMLTINPTFVFWKGGEEAKAKTISVKSGPDFPVKNVKVTATNQDFTTKVEPGGKDEWKLSVQPKATDHAIAGTLTVTPEVPDVPPQLYYVNVSVTATPPPAPAAAASPVPSVPLASPTASAPH